MEQRPYPEKSSYSQLKKSVEKKERTFSKDFHVQGVTDDQGSRQSEEFIKRKYDSSYASVSNDGLAK